MITSNKKIKIFIGTIISVIVILLLWFLLFAPPKNPLLVNIRGISVGIEVERFDKDLRNIFEGNSMQKVFELSEKYEDFFEIYNHEIIGIGGIENQSYLLYLGSFLSDFAVLEAYKAIQEQHKDLRWLNDELDLAFRYFKYHFPEREIPRIVTFNGGFNHSVISNDNFIGIGLDKYLGTDCELYDMLSIPDFARIEMEPFRMQFDVMRAYALMEFPFHDSIDNLINNMIYNGMILYFLDACFPKHDDALKIAYTDRQLAYCHAFEKDMWTYLVSNKLLFSTDYLSIRKFTESAPFTADFGNDSPPRTGNWIGWQIVRSYMKANRNVSLSELMSETDYQKILNRSQYNP